MDEEPCSAATQKFQEESIKTTRPADKLSQTDSKLNRSKSMFARTDSNVNKSKEQCLSTTEGSKGSFKINKPKTVLARTKSRSNEDLSKQVKALRFELEVDKMEVKPTLTKSDMKAKMANWRSAPNMFDGPKSASHHAAKTSILHEAISAGVPEDERLWGGDIEVEDTYTGPHLTWPLTLANVRQVVAHIKSRPSTPCLHPKYVAQLLGKSIMRLKLELRSSVCEMSIPRPLHFPGTNPSHRRKTTTTTTTTPCKPTGSLRRKTESSTSPTRHGNSSDSDEEGASDTKLVLCGDLHGQLADFLLVLEQHGEPSPTTAYLLNGDVTDGGAQACEILIICLLYKQLYPKSVVINRGCHENAELNRRPAELGGGFYTEVTSKFARGAGDETAFYMFQRLFELLPLATVVERRVFVVHGGLFRRGSILVQDIMKAERRGQCPLASGGCGGGGGGGAAEGGEEEGAAIMRDALWAEPREADGVGVSDLTSLSDVIVVPSAEDISDGSGEEEGGGSGGGGGSPLGVVTTFGPDVTARFLEKNGLSLVVRSHQLPASGRGFETAHGDRLITVFTASDYRGVTGNAGAVMLLRPDLSYEVREHLLWADEYCNPGAA